MLPPVSVIKNIHYRGVPGVKLTAANPGVGKRALSVLILGTHRGPRIRAGDAYKRRHPCVRACVRACVQSCVRAYGDACVCAFVRSGVRAFKREREPGLERRETG